MNRFAEMLLEFFFPSQCVICGSLLPLEQKDKCICKDCAQDIPFLIGEQCEKCGRTLKNQSFCHRCALEDFPFSKGAAAFSYEVMQESISYLKFHGFRHDADALGSLMAFYLQKVHEDWIDWADYMTAVPLHMKKEKHRGFNQADRLCRILAEKTGIVYMPHLLERRVYTKPQSTLTAKQRRDNLKDVFALVEGQDVTGKHILLVDDIFTTGTTMKECTRVLLRAGAAEVRVFCLSIVESIEEKMPENLPRKEQESDIFL